VTRITGISAERQQNVALVAEGEIARRRSINVVHGIGMEGIAERETRDVIEQMPVGRCRDRRQQASLLQFLAVG
jgi:hypothetical protein